MKLEKLGIMGGSFSPITKGHIRLANHLITEKILDRVFIMPCYKSLYNKSLVDGEHRLKMIELSERVSNVFPFNWEIRNKIEGRGTYDIMMELKTHFPYEQLYFVMGLDNSQKVKKWLNGDLITNRFSFIVVPREGTEVIDNWFLKEPHIYLEKYVPDDISSTLVKETLKSGGSTEKMLDKGVHDYIIQHNLYENQP